MLASLRQALSTLSDRLLGRPTPSASDQGPAYPLQQLSTLEASLVSSIPDLLILMSRDGTLRPLNSGEGVKIYRHDRLFSSIPATIYDVMPADAAQERMTYVERALQTRQLQQYEYSLQMEGEIRYEEARISICGPDTVLVIIRDITENKQAEILMQLRTKQGRILNRISQQIRQSLQLNDVLNTAVSEIRQWLKVDRVVIYQLNIDGSGDITVESVVGPRLSILGRTIHDPCFGRGEIEPFRQGQIRCHEDIYAGDLQECHVKLLSQFQVQANLVVPILHDEGVWGLMIAHQCTGPRIWHTWEIEVLRQITAQLSIAIQQSQLYELTLQQARREKLLNLLVDAIRQSLDLDLILERATEALLSTFQTSRGVVALCSPTDSAFQYTMTSTLEKTWAVLDTQIPIEDNRHAQAVLAQVDPVVVDNAQEHPLLMEVMPLVESLQIKSMLAVSIRLDDQVKGILCVQQCDRYRQWTWDEQLLIKQVADQLAVAIQHGELYRQVQQINTELDQQVQTRTQQLQRALQNEELLRRITQNIRESLDESHLLAVATQSLGEGLGLTRVAIRQIDLEQQISSLICYFDPEIGLSYGEVSETISDLKPLIDQLSQGQVVQCCFLERPLWPQEQNHTLLICPIADNQILLGSLGASKPSPELFSEAEIQLMQQVAAQCAIAIRQARLYETAQAQVKELEKLNQLKDDFVATVSHELRTPMTNIKMAAKMLQLAVESPEKQSHYLNILERECNREISLINDLLDLQRLETSSKALIPEMISIRDWLERVVGSFQERTQQRQQQLELDIDPNLEVLQTDRLTLERVISELITNACKYTPPQHQIKIRARSLDPMTLEFQIINTGVAIPSDHLPNLFEKFYRIPKADQWQQGGTGLGLSLVKRAVEWLGGKISVESGDGQTAFTIRLPLSSLAQEGGKQS